MIEADAGFRGIGQHDCGASRQDPYRIAVQTAHIGFRRIGEAALETDNPRRGHRDFGGRTCQVMIGPHNRPTIRIKAQRMEGQAGKQGWCALRKAFGDPFVATETGFTISAFTNSGLPMAATKISASRLTVDKSGVLE